jgi:hypothetical protein
LIWPEHTKMTICLLFPICSSFLSLCFTIHYAPTYKRSAFICHASPWFADLCLPPSPYFWLIINWNLCLPIIEPEIFCSCGHDIDIWRPLFPMQKMHQNGIKLLNPRLSTFFRCWNW